VKRRERRAPFEHQSGVAVVLELVEGETISERLRQGPLPLKDTLTVARQMAEAIQEAREKGIIHHNLKPGNVKITPNGRVKVLDFGLAKLQKPIGGDVRSFTSESGAKSEPPHVGSYRKKVAADAPTIQVDTTRPGAGPGTPAYMSPEPARGQEVDKRTDMWAFGCCVYECLSGRKPFRGPMASNLRGEVLKWDRISGWQLDLNGVVIGESDISADASIIFKSAIRFSHGDYWNRVPERRFNRARSHRWLGGRLVRGRHELDVVAVLAFPVDAFKRRVPRRPETLGFRLLPSREAPAGTTSVLTGFRSCFFLPTLPGSLGSPKP